ncbi:MAG: hypothetical protein QW215_00150 [Ignisphaera sp.]
MSLIARYDMGAYGDWFISWLEGFSFTRFISAISRAISSLDMVWRSWTGSGWSVTSLDDLTFNAFLNRLSSYRSQRDISREDVPDWLLTTGASEMAMQSQASQASEAGGQVAFVVNDAYIPGVDMDNVSVARVTGVEVDNRGSFTVRVTVPGERSPRELNIEAPGIASIRFPNLIYDVFGEKRRAVQWNAGIGKWLSLPRISIGNILNVSNAEVLPNIFTPIHTLLPTTSARMVRLRVEVPRDVNATLFLFSGDNFANLIGQVPLNLRSGLNEIRIVGKRTTSIFGTSYKRLPKMQITLANMRSVARVELYASTKVS